MMIGEHNRQHHPTNTYHPSSASSPNNNNYTTMTNHISSPLSHRYLHHHFNPAVNTTTNSILSSSPSSPLSINSLTAADTSPPITPRGSYLLNDYETILAALSRYLPSNIPNNASFSDEHESSDLNAAKYSTDEFRMYDFKVRGCTRAKAHDWTECPFAHPGEKARRRDPRLYGYTGTACTDFRKGSCRRGDSCEFAHGVFECWLHPTRYRTQACKDGKNCRRRVCFFAHTADELRILSPSNGCSHLSPRGSMVKGTVDPFDEVGSLGSPPVTPLGRSGGYLDSSPVTPMCRSLGSCSVSELAASLRNLQLEKVKSMPANRVAWNVNPPAVGVGSPPSPGICNSGYFSLPVTPTSRLGNNMGYVDMWGEYSAEDGSVAVERVESGRELRAKMFEKLSKENPLGRVPDYNPFEQVSAGPDVGWVSELLK